jgi:hypothetical protein
VPLQSIESIYGFLNLLPGLEATLLLFTRTSEYSNWKLVLYWLSTPSPAFNFRHKAGRWPMRYSLSTLCPPRWAPSHDLLPNFRALPWLPQPLKTIGSPEVWFPNSAKQFESTWSGLTSTQYVPPSGFLNLLTVYSSNCPVILFHITSTCGIPPSECSPWKQHRTFIRFDSPALNVLILRPQLPAYSWTNSQELRARRHVRPNKYTFCEVLIRSQVRSHPTSVLPLVGGRYSLGVFNAF